MAASAGGRGGQGGLARPQTGAATYADATTVWFLRGADCPCIAHTLSKARDRRCPFLAIRGLGRLKLADLLVRLDFCTDNSREGVMAYAIRLLRDCEEAEHPHDSERPGAPDRHEHKHDQSSVSGLKVRSAITPTRVPPDGACRL